MYFEDSAKWLKDSNFLMVLIGLGLVYITFKVLKYTNKRGLMKERIRRKLGQVKENQNKLEQHLKNHDDPVIEKRKEIIQLDIEELLKKLQNGDLSCMEVLRAYQAKALDVTKELNCVTEFIKEAEKWAEELDASTDTKKPLHGLPFSVKDNVSVVGYDCTAGISKFIDQSAVEDAALVSALRGLGAIPFCRTNVPQTLLSFGCSNPIWGSTKNPFCKERTPGGSSGGEATLVAAGGSLLGIGSDIGGSIRIPAAFCGVFSIKPTSLRLSYKGFRKSAVGCIGIPSVPGILARDSKTVIMLCKLLLDDGYIRRYFDPDLLPIPWNEQMFGLSNKLRIGYYEECDYFPCTPGVRRAVRVAKEKLEALGHELIPFVPPRVDYVISSVISMFYADQGRYVLEALSVDDIDPLLVLQIKVALKLPHLVKQIIRPLLALIAPRLEPCFMAAAGHQYRHSYQLWHGILKQSEYKANFLADWRNLRLDTCIGPGFACPAPLAKDTGRVTPAFAYACLYNFLDLPAGIVPVTKETEEDQNILMNGGYDFRDLVCKLVKKTTRGATGLPIPVQVIGLPYQEEVVLRTMSILDSAFRV
ncbi:fatty acid amide hydrolase 1-like [Daphnia pulicaria]|uniref:fatty acid amide hydrolase 1-like n=1 Tax=Daphnia pulicaria TaxID=35523 RepID=UPI001EEC2074|nr:fatty acid amide hydrolase 1-like [Daphnia pulicaria]